MTRKYFFPILFLSLVFIIMIIPANTSWSDDDTDEPKVKEQSEYMMQYTGADASLTGAESCFDCHDDKKPIKAGGHMSFIDADPDFSWYGLGCEACHGPGENHYGEVSGILNFKKMNQDEVTNQCSLCHKSLRSYDKKTWKLSEHNFQELTCISCHEGHSVTKMNLAKVNEIDTCTACHRRQLTQFNMRSHHPVNEKSMTCSSCHNSMSGKYDYQLKQEGDHLCFECHADKQGPFVFDMGIGTDDGGDGCLSCHFAHGSNTDQLLRYPGRLCLGCHTDTGQGNHYRSGCWSQGCHSEIHGSNTDPMFLNNPGRGRS